MKNWRDNISKIPKESGIYLFYIKGNLVYIGKATSLRSRVKSYLNPKTNRPIEIMINGVDEVKWKVTDSVLEAIILESNYIKEFKPKYNVKEKDDRSWSYLVLTKGDFPKLEAVRERNLDSKKYKYIFGPYVGVNISEVSKLLHKIFFVSRCNPNSKRPCFDYHLGKCLGVCTNEIDKKDYTDIVIKPLVLFLKGKKKRLVSELEKKMKQASLKENYEEAKRLRNQISFLKRIVDFSLTFSKKEIRVEKRIEGYDISNLGDEIMVGSMVVFDGEKPTKGEYKKFRVKRKGQSDVDSLKEVVSRRLKHKEWKLPDLVLVDGGKPQVNAIQPLFSVPVVGIAKGKKRDKNEIIYSGKDDWVYQNTDILISVRDEAHRFAITYQRNLKRKETFK